MAEFESSAFFYTFMAEKPHTNSHSRNMKKKLIFAALCAAIALFPLSLGAKNSKVEEERFTLGPGERGAFPVNFVRRQTRLDATVNFSKFQSFSVGRGDGKTYQGGWFQITDKEIILFNTVLKDKTLEEDAALSGDKKTVKTIRARVPEEKARYEHGLNLKKAKYITVTIDAGDKGAELTVTTKKGTFSKEFPKWWCGGAPFVTNEGTAPIKAELSFERKMADAPVWFIADSYFNWQNPARWPYYMYNEGYTNWMADHLPGGNAKGLLPCFKHDLEFGTPKIVVWELQGNIAGDEGLTPNPDWLKAFEEFVAICKEKGITPVFTESCSTKRNTAGRNKWIRDHGYRLIAWRNDIVKEDGSGWRDPSWLSKDKVHPTADGAKVLWNAFKRDFPELNQCR